MRNAGKSLAATSEDEVLDAIKALAVREENVMVARHQLWNMHQDADEGVRTFSARLRGQENMCNFTMECSAVACTQVNSYMEPILRDSLVRGLSDYDIYLAILQDKNQDMSLDECLKFIEARESGKRSATKMKDALEVAAARSSLYRR